jgi:acyl carrier protein
VDSRDEIEAVLRGALADLFPRQDVAGLPLDADLVQALDLDSMAVIDFALEVERRLDLHVPDDDLAELTSLDAAIDYVAAHRGSPTP